MTVASSSSLIQFGGLFGSMLNNVYGLIRGDSDGPGCSLSREGILVEFIMGPSGDSPEMAFFITCSDDGVFDESCGFDFPTLLACDFSGIEPFSEGRFCELGSSAGRLRTLGAVTNVFRNPGAGR